MTAFLLGALVAAVILIIARPRPTKPVDDRPQDRVEPYRPAPAPANDTDGFDLPPAA